MFGSDYKLKDKFNCRNKNNRIDNNKYLNFVFINRNKHCEVITNEQLKNSIVLGKLDDIRKEIYTFNR